MNDYLSNIGQSNDVLCDVENLVQIIRNNPNYLLIPDPRSDHISCNGNCIIYIIDSLKAFHREMSIDCSDNTDCAIVWYVHVCILNFLPMSDVHIFYKTASTNMVVTVLQ